MGGLSPVHDTPGFPHPKVGFLSTHHPQKRGVPQNPQAHPAIPTPASRLGQHRIAAEPPPKKKPWASSFILPARVQKNLRKGFPDVIKKKQLKVYLLGTNPALLERSGTAAWEVLLPARRKARGRCSDAVAGPPRPFQHRSPPPPPPRSGSLQGGN